MFIFPEYSLILFLVCVVLLLKVSYLTPQTTCFSLSPLTSLCLLQALSVYTRGLA